MKRKLNLWHKKYKSKSNFLSCLLLFHSTSPLQPLPWNLMLPLQKGICSLWSNCAKSWFWAHLSSVWVFIFIFHNPSQHCLLCKVCQMERVISEMVDHHVPYRLQTYGETILKICLGEKRIILYLNLLYYKVLLQFTVHLITILKKKKELWGRSICWKQLSSFLTLEAFLWVT